MKEPGQVAFEAFHPGWAGTAADWARRSWKVQEKFRRVAAAVLAAKPERPIGTCATCRFMVQTAEHCWECHRHAPVAFSESEYAGMSGWPNNIKPTDSCGDFEAK